MPVDATEDLTITLTKRCERKTAYIAEITGGPGGTDPTFSKTVPVDCSEAVGKTFVYTVDSAGATLGAYDVKVDQTTFSARITVKQLVVKIVPGHNQALKDYLLINRVIRKFCVSPPSGHADGLRAPDASWSTPRGEPIGGAAGPPVRPG